MLPTIASLIHAPLPPHKIDGADISGVMQGRTNQSPHDVLYFYYHQNDLEALRSGKWKLELARQYRTLNGRPGGKNHHPVEYSHLRIAEPQLYDLDADPGEKTDVAAANPEVMKKLLAYAGQAREELGDDLTNHEGTGRRPRQFVTGGPGVYPSDTAFPKALDDKYRPRPDVEAAKAAESKPAEASPGQTIETSESLWWGETRCLRTAIVRTNLGLISLAPLEHLNSRSSRFSRLRKVFHPHTRANGIAVAEDVVHAGDGRPEFVVMQALGRERRSFAGVRTIPIIAGDLVGGVRRVLQ
jgi:hypothetical protein